VTTKPAAAAAKHRRPQARRGEGDRLRGEILEATHRLLVETGDEDAVSIRAVADAIGVTPPAIYRHFEDKTSLLFEVCAESFERMDRYMLDAAAGIDDPLEVLATRARAYLRFGLDNPEHYRIMFMGRSALTPPRFADETLVGAGAFAHLVECVQACIDAEAFRPELADAHAVSLALWASIHGVTSLGIAKPYFPGPPTQERLELVLAVMLRGVLRDPA
jgi:AcrR family transcriptional regulator